MDKAKATGMKPKWWSRPHRPADAEPEQPATEDPGRDDQPSPKPLHGEDPYGTPPYGGPGPWAPAPPVQHPHATPPRGVQLPPSLPSGAPQSSTPAHGTPLPAPGQQSVPPAQPPSWQRYDPWAAPPEPGSQHTLPGGENGAGRRGRRQGIIAGAIALALVAGVAGGVVGAYLERTGGLGAVTLPQAPAEDAKRTSDSVAGIAAATLPGVVTLHVRGGGEQGTGTGFVLDQRGHILTNHHVVGPESADGRIQVTFSGGETATARVIGGDSGYDLAVVKVDGIAGLKPLPLGNSDSVRVGDPVVAIGAPFDLAGTVTSGIISAKERPITAGGQRDGSDISYVNALQTDAPINPGNSGGPLVDAKGRVIGINSAIRAATSGSGVPGDRPGGSIGLGFAIPINQGKRVAEELINTGRATHPVIGVSLDMSYTGDGARVGTPDGVDGPAVVPGGPGDKAGIEEGDIITAVDGVRVRGGEELIVRIRSHRPGDQLELTVERSGEEQSIEVTLGTASDE
ncbi:S1C family serine protease [Streptomyces gobiensis]|uniref:S1C family serine protease n=1 Tax=Streptomyces gobiensis TaxID=2875706 RepID=UPI001E607FCD|nr:trypsin-like peptidase domain-containing protein [Streptomyces gobiensis]UGY93486.1 trypsin-like peptidase domain-containing protein [Streptomyces gobiensis]